MKNTDSHEEDSSTTNKNKDNCLADPNSSKTYSE